MGALLKSRPVWGAWIEIDIRLLSRKQGSKSRPVWGAWIEMIIGMPNICGSACRAPYGARGLKSFHRLLSAR